MKKRLCLGGLAAVIDVEATRTVYSVLNVTAKNQIADQNFQLNLRKRWASIHPFFQGLGIDPLKMMDQWVPEVNPYIQAVCYAGHYPVVGVVEGALSGEELELIGRTTMEFGFSLCYGRVSEKLSIQAVVQLPWLLEPPIPIPHYINQAKLPQASGGAQIRDA